MRATGIFTGTTSSPCQSARQSHFRYAIRAGRNLPDKEFRYLRTVIVTAAVHWGFSSQLLKPLPLTFQHWAGVSPYMSALAFAGTCVFVKQSPGPVICDHQSLGPYSLHHQWYPFSLSYGVNLPSSLTRDHPFTLRFLPLPTCVGLRYGHLRSG